MRMFGALAIAAPLVVAAAAPALALSDQECDRRFAAARTTQSLNGMDRQTFGRTQCVDPSGNTATPNSQMQDSQMQGQAASGSQATGTVAKDPARQGSPTTPQANKPAVVVPSKP